MVSKHFSLSNKFSAFLFSIYKNIHIFVAKTVTKKDI